ncbi:MAG TPA: RHS repeat-associated core domain-containing protein [Streptosporangiaceae bacterium]|nr:RHS repeat-associated core domain-containing protein [Streptosporangiaceae bacterium]
MLRVALHRWRWSVTALSVVLALVASLLVGLKAIPGFNAPAAPAGAPVPVHVVAGQRVQVPKMTPSHRRAPSWPAANSATVALTAPTHVGRPAAGPSTGSVRAGNSPVWVGQPDATGTAGKAAAGQAPVSRASVSLASQRTSRSLGIHGLVLAVQRADGNTATGRVHVSVSYKTFAQAYGGDYGSRLRLVELPACALTSPTIRACRTQTPLGSLNDTRRDWAGTDITLPGTLTTASVTPGTSAEPVVLTSAVRPSGVVLALVPAPSGSAGNFAAEPLSEANTGWVGGASSGAYTWSYPIGVPPVPGDLTPPVALSYDSQATSGLDSSTNNQASWVGDGWNYSPGYIETDYTTCSADAGEPATGDLCPNGATVSMSLNGVTTTLVNGSGKWIPSVDGGQTVKQSGNTFEVIEPNGIQYWFGLNQLPGFATGDQTTNSLWTVPVWEGCGQAALCSLPWRYNLDYVVDPHGNAMAYFYNGQSNSYAEQNGTTANGTYTQGGVLTKIEYGFRAGQVYTTTHAGQVNFTSTSTRQDAPADLACTTGTACAINSPTFWNTSALTTITTQALKGTTLANTDSYALATTYPATGDPTTDPSLWLSSVTKTGQDGATAITLPPVSFAGTPLPNRVQTAADTAAGYSDLTRFYLTAITSDTGGVTAMAYSPTDPAPCAAGTFPSPASNTAACYPDYWTPPGATAPVQDWFNQYTEATYTQTDTTGGDPAVVTSYTYANPAWHYDLGTVSRSGPATYDQWRGFKTVTTQTGTAPDPITQSTATFLQGMSQNGPPGSTGPVVTLTTSRGQPVTDFNQFAGMALEQITYNGAGPGQVVTDTINLPWTSSAVVTNPSLNQSAFLTGTGSVLAYTPLAAGGTRESISNFTYNSSGLVSSQSAIPDTTSTSESTCTDTTYAANAGTGLVDLTATVTTDAGACNASGQGTGALVSQTENFYDGQGLGIAPTAGNLTKTEQATATAHFDITTSSYDQYGRQLTSTDPDGNVTTAYTPAAGAEPTSTSVTDPMGLITTTTYDPARDLSLTVTTPAGNTTTDTYDALGRQTAEWMPGNPTTGPATTTYSYAISSTAPPVTTEQDLEPNGNYQTTDTIDDSFGVTREVQTETAGGGTDITDTTYNSDGWNALTAGPYYVAGPPSGTLVEAAASSVHDETGLTYDGDGRVIKQTSLDDGTQTWETDTAYGGNYTTVTPPSGGTPRTTWTDGRGLTTAIWQYHAGVPVSVSDPAADYDATAYTYNAGQKLATITDAAGNTWTYAYDLLGDQTSATDPDNGTTTTTYDAAQQQTSVTDARGKTSSSTYDADGRKTALYDTTGGAPENSGDQIAAWTYDTIAKGQLTSSTSFQNGSAYTEQVTGYAANGQPSGTQTVIPVSQGALAGTYTQTDTYAPNGQLTSYTDSAAGGLPAETVTTGYDNAGNPASLTGTSPYVDSLTYTNLGQPQQYTMGTTSEPAYLTDTYDPHTGSLTRQDTQTGTAQTQVDDLNYAYSNAGDITSEADAPAGVPADVQCFQYDYLNRLVQAWAQPATGCAATPSASAEGGPAPYWDTYAYNTIGNLTGTTSTTPAGAVTTTADTYPATTGSARPHAITGQTITAPGGTTTASSYGYNADGALTSVTGTTQNQALTWNDTGQLSQDTVTPAGGTAQNTTYTYDAGGNLLLTADPGSTTLNLSDEELTLSGGTVTGTRYYSIGSHSVATRTGSTGVSYLAGDQQGTDSVAISAATLTVTRRYYDPYGNPRGTTPSSFPTGQKGFVGGTSDTTTGLTNLGAREYQPGTGSFISPDPLLNSGDPQNLNAYAYAADNPATESDPTGALPTCSGCGPDLSNIEMVPDPIVVPTVTSSIACQASWRTSPNNSMRCAAAPEASSQADPSVSTGCNGTSFNHPHWSFKYNCNWYIGPVKKLKDKDPADLIVKILKNINTIFPFPVKHCGFEGNKYYCTLHASPGIPHSTTRVLVTFPTPTSFKFTVIHHGYFDAPGSTITFSLYEKNGNLYLHQHGIAYNSDLFGQQGYERGIYASTWQAQACNLQVFLHLPATNAVVILPRQPPACQENR